MFKHGLTSWHIQFVVNNWYDDADLKYMRDNFSNEDRESARMYIAYTKEVSIKPKIIAM